MRRRTLVALCALLAAVAIEAGADTVSMARVGAAFEDARRFDEPTRRFMELVLRVAGVAWIAVEWIAAIYLIRGFHLLRRWFAEEAG